MNYNFNINGKLTKVWVWNTDYHKYVTVYDKRESYDRSIREDANGRFFTWNKTKVYLDSFVTFSMKELKEKIEKGEHVTDDDLCQSIMHDGIENVRFICPLNPVSVVIPGLGFALCDGNKYEDVECKITEKRHTVKDHYKIGVIPNTEERLHGGYDYYVSDMISMIITGRIKIVA